VLRARCRQTHQCSPDPRVPKRRAPSGKFVFDGSGAANRRSAVAVADWVSVDRAWAPGPGGRRRLQGPRSPE
jgi:hypothetical protein